MGIRAKFNSTVVRQRMNEVLQRIDAAIIQALKRLGELCVKEAREHGNYIDQTGNLRSSIGYVIVANGEIIESAFSSANKDQEGKGVNTGKAYAEDLSKNYSKGYALIVVAGMSYAAAVESKSRDVLTSAEMYAKEQLPKMLEQLRRNIDKMKV